LIRWLGTNYPDPGCEGAFEILDLYADARRLGMDTATRYPSFETHVGNCGACREDTEGLLAAIDDLERLPG